MRDLVTTALELVGILLLAAAAGIGVGLWSVPAGVAVAGMCLLAASAALSALAAAPKSDL